MLRRQIPSIIALLCFEAAARHENFARAAEAVSLTQSTLSRHIQALEAQLKQPLFLRARQRVRLNAAGRQLQRELTPQLEALEATLLKVSSINDFSGAINVGVYPTLGSRWLMPILIALAEETPSLSFNTITYLSNAEIDHNLVDIAIVQGDPPWPACRSSYLMPESLVAVASPSFLPRPARDPADLLGSRILHHVTRPDSWSIWFASQGRQLTDRPLGPAFTQFEMLIDAVRRGYGLAILPRVLVERDLREGALVLAHAHEASPDSAYYLLIPDAKAGTPRIERLRKLLLSKCR